MSGTVSHVTRLKGAGLQVTPETLSLKTSTRPLCFTYCTVTSKKGGRDFRPSLSNSKTGAQTSEGHAQTRCMSCVFTLVVNSRTSPRLTHTTQAVGFRCTVDRQFALSSSECLTSQRSSDVGGDDQ